MEPSHDSVLGHVLRERSAQEIEELVKAAVKRAIKRMMVDKANEFDLAGFGVEVCDPYQDGTDTVVPVEFRTETAEWKIESK